MTDILIASHGHFASGLQSSLDILTGMGKQVNVIVTILLKLKNLLNPPKGQQ